MTDSHPQGLSELLDGRQLALKDLAAAADISISAIYHWRGNTNDAPPVRSLPKVELGFKALGCPLTAEERQGLISRANTHDLAQGAA